MLETIKREEEKESSKENNKNNKQTKINKPKQLSNSIQSKKMHFELKISFLKLGCLFFFLSYAWKDLKLTVIIDLQQTKLLLLS